MRNDEFEPLMRAMCAAFNREPSTDMFLAYWTVCESISIDDFTIGVRRAMTECKFMPVPAELIDLCGRDTLASRSMKAYSTALSSVSTLGPYKHVDFEDRVINAVVRNMGGWETFCERFHGSESEKWARKEFLDAYRVIGSGTVGDEHGRALPGISNGQMKGGRMIEPIPLRIKCESAAHADRNRAITHIEKPYVHKKDLIEKLAEIARPENDHIDRLPN